jgi:hypothetical protein
MAREVRFATQFLRLAVVALPIVLGGGPGCGGERRGTACGGATCQPGQACCLDCDGRGTCVAPGGGCPGYACLGDGGGGPDAGTGIACGQTVCQPGQVCCVDCDGGGTCGAPGMACPGYACLPDGGAPVACGDLTCAASETCCASCPGPLHYCGPPGSDCPLAVTCPDGGACGHTGEPCCAGACEGALECCSGVPYPQDGLCAVRCEAVSDRAAKHRFAPVDVDAVLERVAGLELATWSYAGDAARARHLGPTSQDFHAAFGLGASDRRIDLVDANGVLMAAVQALSRRVAQLERTCDRPAGLVTTRSPGPAAAAPGSRSAGPRAGRAARRP